MVSLQHKHRAYVLMACGGRMDIAGVLSIYQQLFVCVQRYVVVSSAHVYIADIKEGVRRARRVVTEPLQAKALIQSLEGPLVIPFLGASRTEAVKGADSVLGIDRRSWVLAEQAERPLKGGLRLLKLTGLAMHVSLVDKDRDRGSWLRTPHDYLECG